MRVYIVLMLLGLLFGQSESSFAQGHSLYCGNADSTSATQACLKRHLDAAQKRLNKTYKKLSMQLEGEKSTELEALQKIWLEYRDAECMWEAENTETPALKHINELSCMARLTDDRADILSILNNDKMTTEGAREYGSFPRWMNALASADGDVYWNYADRQSFDLNCDGEEEFIMNGVETHLEKQAKNSDLEHDLTKKALYQKASVIAITQNPSIGKPIPTIFKFAVMEDGDEATLCSSEVNFKMIETAEKSDNEEDVPMCHTKLEIRANGCADDVKTIVWSDKGFMIAPVLSDDEDQ